MYKLKRNTLRLLVTILLACPMVNLAQITTQQARSVDSAMVVQFLESGNFHTTNYHDLPGGGVFTWDAGNGLYMGISDYAVAWSHTGQVEDTLAASIDATPGQAYHLFNLALMPNAAVYSDSVTNWLDSLGIPVGLNQPNAERLTIRTNHTGFQITFPENGSYELLILNVEGKRIRMESGKAIAGASKNIQLPDMPRGLLIVKLIYRSSRYFGKFVR